MNKLIPILSIVVSALCLSVSATGLITVSIALSVPQLTLIAVPTAIIGTAMSAVSTGFSAFFFKSKLCRIAFFTDIASLVISTVALALWRSLL